MKLLSGLIILLCCSGTFAASFFQCYWVNSATVDCDNFPPNATCGTDLVTYKNKCEFSRAHCADNYLDLRHYGACTAADVSNPVPESGSEVVFDFMCTHLSHMDCPVGQDKVCASDGRDYINYCEYEKAKCTHRNLHVVDCTI